MWWMYNMVASGMGGEDAELHPHSCCHQCWGREGLELFQGHSGPCSLDVELILLSA